MRRNDHFVVPESRFRLVKGEDSLATYTFKTHTAKHLFCSACGISAFYRPRSNPDGYGITLQCVDGGVGAEGSTIASVEFREFDGQNWESFIEASGIREQSKVA